MDVESGTLKVSHMHTGGDLCTVSLTINLTESYNELKLAGSDNNSSVPESEEVSSRSRDRAPPAIHLPKEITSASLELVLVGKVTDQSNIKGMTVDGEAVTVGADGSFSHSLYVPRRGSKVQIVAEDIYGNKAEKFVVVTRPKGKEAGKIFFAPLNPRAVRVSENPGAVALVIGISEYSIAPDAPFADLDAEYFADFAYLALGVPFENMKILVNSNARGTNMLRNINRWLPAIIKPGETDVYVFFAGHGLASLDGNNLYLLPEDGQPSRIKDTAILQSVLFGVLISAEPHSIAVFMDTSFSGGARGGKPSLPTLGR